MTPRARFSKAALAALLSIATLLAAPDRVARAGDASAPLAGDAPAPLAGDARVSPSLVELRAQYGQNLYRGLLQLRANKEPGEAHVVGDNTDAAGMYWTKSSNLGLDLISTLVAAERGWTPEADAREHVRGVLGVLGVLPTHHGVFPEVVQLDQGIRAEVSAGRIRYSSIDSAWVTLALSLVEAYYETTDRALAQSAAGLLAAQDYAPFVGADGLMGGGLVVDAATERVVERFGFAYADRNSEARPLVLALVGMGKLPPSAWTNLRYAWFVKEGVRLAQGWRWSAFVELSGELLLDETSLAPLSLGQSHANYVLASERVARRLGHRVWGYAPSGSSSGGYQEHGLNSPLVVSPYAAGLLAATGNPSAVANLSAILHSLPNDGRPLPDGLDPKTGQVSCAVARTLDQALLFLALNVDTLRQLASRTPWYAAAEQKTRELDRTCQPPAVVPAAPTEPGCEHCAKQARGEPAPQLPPLALERAAFSGAEREAALELGRAALDSVFRAAQSSQSAPGGQVQLAASQAELAAAASTRTWFGFLPDFVLALRRESGQDVSGSGADPLWWGELQTRFAISPGALQDAIASDRAQELAAILPEIAAHDVWLSGLRAQLELYTLERELALLQERRASLGALLPGLEQTTRPGADAERSLLAARLAALDQASANAEGRRQQAAARLSSVTGRPLSVSGLDLRLGLNDVVGLVARAAADRVAPEERRATADVELQRSRSEAQASRAWYLPELHAALFAAIPKERGDAQPGAHGSRWVVDRVTGELSAGFTWLPGAALEGRAQGAALERSQWQLKATERARAESTTLGRARLVARAAAWSEDSSLESARAQYADRVERFRRGELDAGAVTGASAALLEVSAAKERLFSEALDATLLALAQGAGDRGAGSRGAGDRGAGDQGGDRGAWDQSAPRTGVTHAAPERWQPRDAHLAQGAALGQAARLRAAEAEALRADAHASAVRAGSFRVDLRAGILYPFYLRSEAGAAAFSTDVSGGPAAFGPRLAQDTTALAQSSLDVVLGDREAFAARAEADLRAAERTLAYKSELSEQARARLELAYARAGLRQAAAHRDLWTQHRAAIEQMRAQGWLDDTAIAWQADLKAGAASRAWQRAGGRLREAQIRWNELLGRELASDIEIEESPEELERWLEEAYYPGAGLVGYASELPPRIAELDARWAEARVAALRNPPSSVSISLQATRSLLGTGYSASLGVGFELDRTSDPAQVLAAAERAGAVRGQLETARRSLERERRLARLALDSAAGIHATLSERRARIAAVLQELIDTQAADLEQHASSKLRTRDAVLEQLADIDQQLVDARQELALAKLRTLELGVAHGAGTTSERTISEPAKPPTLRLAVEQLVEHAPEVTAADAATSSVLQERLRPALLSGFRAQGPWLGVTDEVLHPQPSATSRDLRASIGAGVSYGFAEGLAFLATEPRTDAARLARESSRRAAWPRALRAIGRLWQAREAHRLRRRADASTRQRLESLSLPRYHAAHISAATLADTEVQQSNALVALSRAAADELAERSALAADGLTIDDPVLDEFATCRVPERTPAFVADDELRSDPRLLEAERRTRAAATDRSLAALRMLGPPTVFLELAPEGLSSEQLGETSWARRVPWISSLVVPITPRLLGEGVEAGALADVQRDQRDAVERALAAEQGELRPRFDAALETWQAAQQRRTATARALEALGRARDGGVDPVTLDGIARAEDDTFDAEQAELEARAPLLVLCAQVRGLGRR
jgi:hypothetical protein